MAIIIVCGILIFILFYNKTVDGKKFLKDNEKYFELVLTQIFKILKSAYDKENTLENLNKMKKNYNSVVTPFIKWINCYWNLTDRENTNLQNKVLFDINNEKDYLKAIIYYISGMTDNYAIECYNNIIGF